MITPYRPIIFSNILAYMLQNVEYDPVAYIRWLLRTHDFTKVMYRRTLEPTKAAKMFRLFACVTMMFLYASAVFIGMYAVGYAGVTGLLIPAALILLTPHLAALLILLPLIAARILISAPKEKRLIAASKEIFNKTNAVKIAVAGSYGKTSMKELLGTILSEGKNVAITPANKNVASSHALFAHKLKGTEDVLVVEFGEGEPGDVKRFSETLRPNIVMITGIAPAHLDHYATLDEAARDIFTAAEFVDAKNVYVNADSQLARPYIKDGYTTYSEKGTHDASVTNTQVTVSGLSFILKTKQNTYDIKTALLGRHTIGPLVAAILIAEKMGLTHDQTMLGISKIRPYEHRMQPREQYGAWIIDDTYNGNIEGMDAGLALLSELEAKRKIYVTPGLVDQGVETESVHIRLGELIADANPTIVVLMRNSVTNYIQKGLEQGGYAGEVRIETDPLDFYTNLENFVAGGDVVLMQNDWPDNYA